MLRHALIIGCNGSLSNPSTRLRSAEHDMQRVCEFLLQDGPGWHRDRIALFGREQDICNDAQGIEKRLEKTVNSIAEGDFIFAYATGHATVRRGQLYLELVHSTSQRVDRSYLSLRRLVEILL